MVDNNFCVCVSWDDTNEEKRRRRSANKRPRIWMTIVQSFRRSFNTYYIWRTTPSFHRHRSRQKSKMGDRAAPRRDSFSTLLVMFFSFWVSVYVWRPVERPTKTDNVLLTSHYYCRSAPKTDNDIARTFCWCWWGEKGDAAATPTTLNFKRERKERRMWFHPFCESVELKVSAICTGFWLLQWFLGWF